MYKIEYEQVLRRKNEIPTEFNLVKKKTEFNLVKKNLIIWSIPCLGLLKIPYKAPITKMVMGIAIPPIMAHA